MIGLASKRGGAADARRLTEHCTISHVEHASYYNRTTVGRTC
jgi:hypothetical protein